MTISGIVTASGEAVFRLEARNPNGEDTTVESVIDTGSTGYLTLPRSVVESLSLPLLSSAPVTLADGSTATLDVHEALVAWHGRSKAVECLATEGSPLAGMALLHGSELRMQVVGGGVVEIKELSV